MTATLQHAPIERNRPYDVQEDELHSLFATITGFSFSILAVTTGFVASRRSYKILAFLTCITAPLLTMLMFQIEEYRGIWQRLIFVFLFGWVPFAFSKYEVQEYSYHGRG